MLCSCASSSSSQRPAQIPIRAAKVDRELSPSTEAVIDTAYITGRVLTLRFRWANACDNDSFDLIHSGISTRSIPPQLPVFLHRKPSSNSCPSSQQLERRFDLSPLISDRMGAVFNLDGYRRSRLQVPRASK
jgi:hypothetical protein